MPEINSSKHERDKKFTKASSTGARASSLEQKALLKTQGTSASNMGSGALCGLYLKLSVIEIPVPGQDPGAGKNPEYKRPMG
jgi:hypothetical protein